MKDMSPVFRIKMAPLTLNCYHEILRRPFLLGLLANIMYERLKLVSLWQVGDGRDTASLVIKHLREVTHSITKKNEVLISLLLFEVIFYSATITVK